MIISHGLKWQPKIIKKSSVKDCAFFLFMISPIHLT